jgi:hypothetical protein
VLPKHSAPPPSQELPVIAWHACVCMCGWPGRARTARSQREGARGARGFKFRYTAARSTRVERAS